LSNPSKFKLSESIADSKDYLFCGWDRVFRKNRTVLNEKKGKWSERTSDK
jgi:hypothetical protein